MVECFLEFEGLSVALSLTRSTMLCPCTRLFIPCLVLVKPRGPTPLRKYFDWDVKNHIKQKLHTIK